MAAIQLSPVSGTSLEEILDAIEKQRKDIEFIMANLDDDNIKQVNFSKVTSVEIDQAQIKNLLVDTANIKDLAVSSAKIADASITNAKIDRATVNKLVVTTADIQDAAITNAKIDRATVDKLVVVSADIADAQIQNAHIENATIDGSAKIKLASITTGLIEDAAITEALIADLSVTDAKIVDLTATKLTAGTIDTGLITISGTDGKLLLKNNRIQVFDNQAVPIERVAMGDVWGDGSVYGFLMRGADGQTVLMDIDGVKSAGITDGAITNPKIGSGAVKNENIFAGTITGDRLVADTITAREIKAGTITAVSGIIANAAIGTAQIVDGAITTAKIGDAQITSAKIISLDAHKLNVGDFTNLCVYDENTNPGSETVVTISGTKYFRIGTAAWDEVLMAQTKKLEFKVGDEYYSSFMGYKDAAVGYVNCIVRYYYTDGTWSNAGTAGYDVTTANKLSTCTVKITNAPDSAKTLSRIEWFIEKDSTSGYVYIRNIELRKKYGGSLIVDGSISADKLNVTSLSAISANIGNITGGTITGVTLTSSSGSNSITLSGATFTSKVNGRDQVKINGSEFELYDDGQGMSSPTYNKLVNFGSGYTVQNPNDRGFAIRNHGNHFSVGKIIGSVNERHFHTDYGTRTTIIGGAPEDQYGTGDLNLRAAYYSTSEGNSVPNIRVYNSGNYASIYNYFGRNNSTGTSASDAFVYDIRMFNGTKNGASTSLFQLTKLTDGKHYAFMGATLDMQNNDIVGVNALRINDPGGGEGIIWDNGNDWKIVEAPDDLSNAAGHIQFASGGVRRATISTGGNIYATGNIIRLQDTSNTCFFQGVAGTTGYSAFGTYGKGYIYAGADSSSNRIYSTDIYNRTYSNAANLYITTEGTLGRSTSATKYKLNIEPLQEDFEKILTLQPKTWYDKAATESYADFLTKTGEGEDYEADIPPLERIPGLIAEDLVAAGLEKFVQYKVDKDGNREVEGLMYDRLWTLLIPIVKGIKNEIAELKEEIVLLKGIG